MWIFTSNSFLSVVKHRDLPDHLLVRARNKGDIEAVFPKAEVIRTPTGDYLFRAPVLREGVSKVIADQITNIDYVNFKNSIPSDSFHDACIEVWDAMYKYQHKQKNK